MLRNPPTACYSLPDVKLDANTTKLHNFFSDKIAFRSSFKSELWPRHRIGHRLELSMDEFLPCIDLPSSFLSKVWNYATSLGKGVSKSFDRVTHVINQSETGLQIVCKDLVQGTEHNSEAAKIFIKLHQYPSANMLQITKAEMMTFCEDLRKMVTTHKRTTQVNLQNALELEDESVESSEQLPDLWDYIKLGYAFAVDQTTHKLLAKILAMVPNVTVSLRPIKGFAVVSTELSIKLLGKGPSGSKLSGFETGFLTMDQEHRVVPLDPDDPKCGVYTLIGLWVTGLPIPEVAGSAKEKAMDRSDKAKRVAEKEDQKASVLKDPRVMAAILRFLFSEEIKSRISPREKRGETCQNRFLLINFTGTREMLPQFLEFELSEKDKGTANNSWMLLEGACTVSRVPKNIFAPIKLRLTCKQNDRQDLEYYCVYRLSHILESLQAPKPKAKENINPNVSASKTKKCMETALKPPQPRFKACLTGSTNHNFTRFSNLATHGYEPLSENADIKRSLTFFNKRPDPAEESNPEQLDDTDFENIIDSTCLQTTKLGTRHYTDDCQFPAYPRQTPALRTPEYNLLSPESEEQLMHLVMENNKNIQMMQQFVMQLTKHLMEAKNAPPPAVEECITVQSNVVPILDNNVSSTNNSLSNLNKLLVVDKDSNNDSQNQFSGVESSQGRERKVSFTLDASKIEARSGADVEQISCKDEVVKEKESEIPQEVINEQNYEGALQDKETVLQPQEKEQTRVQDVSICVPKIIDPTDLTLSSSSGSGYPTGGLNTSDHYTATMTGVPYKKHPQVPTDKRQYYTDSNWSMLIPKIEYEHDNDDD